MGPGIIDLAKTFDYFQLVSVCFIHFHFKCSEIPEMGPGILTFPKALFQFVAKTIILIIIDFIYRELHIYLDANFP